MRKIIEITSLIILGAYWTYAGNHIESSGNWLNGLTPVPVFGYAFWGLLVLVALYLSISFLVMLYEVLNGKKLVNVLIVAVFILLAYFASDIVEKGKTLNELTPYPVLGWAFWTLIVFFIYWQVLYPIVVFASLKRFHEQGLYERAGKALKALKKDKENPLYIGILNAKNLEEESALREHLEAYDKTISEKADAIILNYSKITGITVVVSSNKWLDSVALLYMQSRMIVELSKLYGGKPSLVFNFLCFVWMLLSSGVYLILHGLLVENAEAVASELAENLAENIAEDLDVQADALKGTFSGTPFVGMVASVTSVLLGPVLQASVAGVNVYMMGKMFLWKIQGDSRACSYKSYMATRRKARLLLAKNFMKSAPDVSVFKNAIKNGVKTMLKEDEEV